MDVKEYKTEYEVRSCKATYTLTTNLTYDTVFDKQLVFDIPGVEKKDITLSLDRDSITVAAERTSTSTTTPTDADGSEYKRMERFSGRVYRTLVLPEGIHRERIHADYQNGVLRVKIPKTQHVKSEHTKIHIKG